MLECSNSLGIVHFSVRFSTAIRFEGLVNITHDIISGGLISADNTTIDAEVMQGSVQLSDHKQRIMLGTLFRRQINYAYALTIVMDQPLPLSIVSDPPLPVSVICQLQDHKQARQDGIFQFIFVDFQQNRSHVELLKP